MVKFRGSREIFSQTEHKGGRLALSSCILLLLTSVHSRKTLHLLPSFPSSIRQPLLALLYTSGAREATCPTDSELVPVNRSQQFSNTIAPNGRLKISLNVYSMCVPLYNIPDTRFFTKVKQQKQTIQKPVPDGPL